jgi:hypothetical protein
MTSQHTGGDGGTPSTTALSFRHLGREDFVLLSHWLQRPHVEVWWREAHDVASIEAR